MKSLSPRLAALMFSVSLMSGCVGWAGAGVGDLPTGLRSPDSSVVCNDARATCYDRYGPSIGLTEAFLGKKAAANLTQELKRSPPDSTSFSPAIGIVCRWGSGPCRAGDAVQQPLTEALYHPAPRKPGLTAEQAAMLEVDWVWLGTRYADLPAVAPPQDARYRIRLDKDGALQVLADCNQAGGQYNMSGSKLSLRIVHSTLAACAPDSLDSVFTRDLQRVSGFFLQAGELHLELGGGAGAMLFSHPRQPL